MIRIVAMALVASCVPVAAQQLQCGPRAVVVKTLTEKYAETRRAIGLNGGGYVMEVWAGASGTWTITMTRADGVTCILTAGSGYEAVIEPAGVPG